MDMREMSARRRLILLCGFLSCGYSFLRRMKRRVMGWKKAHMGTEVGGFGIMWPAGHFL